MKNLLLLFAVIVSFYSCTKESDDTTETLDYTGKWELVKMTGNVEGSETTGSNMEWQESYIINENKTFTKTRTQGDSTKTVSGTYTFSEAGIVDESVSQEVAYIEFIYDKTSEIIGSCNFSGNPKEYLYFTSKSKLKSTWESCDGPGLEYIKK